MEAGTLAVLVAAAFFGALVQAATGFGFAIVAAPLFLWATASTAAIPLLVALHVVQSLLLVPQVWHKASGWYLRRLVAGAIVGTPAGLWLYRAADVRSLKLAIGVTILVVVGLLIRREARPPAAARHVAAAHGTLPTVLTGIAAGAMTALLVMPGPPLMVYFMGENRAGDEVRALSLSFFALCYAAVSLAHLALQGYALRDLQAIAVLTPVVVLGTMAGSALAGGFSEAAFRLAILLLLVTTGVGAVASALLGP